MEPSKFVFPKREPLPKLMACAGKKSLDNIKNELLFHMPVLNAKDLRRAKHPLYECLEWEMSEDGFIESAKLLRDLIEDNLELKKSDEIGIIVDLRGSNDYLEKIETGIKNAETFRMNQDSRSEVLAFLELADYFAEEGKGILWLAEKFYLIAMAVAAKILTDGGRLSSCSQYYYGKFLIQKFGESNYDEAYDLLSKTRNICNGKTWLLAEVGDPDGVTVFAAVAIQLHFVLLEQARAIRQKDPFKADRLCRMAEKRADDAENMRLKAEAITELGISQLMSNNLNNALRSFEKALDLSKASNYIEGICEGYMHVASALQRLGDYEGAGKSLSTMGALSMKNGLRRHLGVALHLLGELHLRRSKPDMATPHLREAFNCFMGEVSKKMIGTFKQFGSDLDPVVEETKSTDSNDDSEQDVRLSHELELLCENRQKPAYIGEAEQSRLMMAISSGQEKIASYFRTLEQSADCAVSRATIIDWKLHGDAWWVQRRKHDLQPCLCPKHNRTPLDILRNETGRSTSMSLVNMRAVTAPKHMDLPSYRQEDIE